MKMEAFLFQVVLILIFGQSIKLIAGDKHTYGDYTGQYDYDARRFFKRTVIDDVNKVPKKYTLYHKYLGSRYKDVQYFEIDVNVPSTGSVNVYNNEKVDATIHIDSAYNVTVVISIYGSLSRFIPRYVGFPKSHYREQSLTFVDVRNATKTSTKTYRNSIGMRRKNDQLLFFESKNVTNHHRFPSRSFSYSADTYINYVGFSFDSPTAVALLNTTFVGETEFNAVAYDMNADHFVANMSVYGVRRRPGGFVGVI